MTYLVVNTTKFYGSCCGALILGVASCFALMLLAYLIVHVCAWCLMGCVWMFDCCAKTEYAKHMWISYKRRVKQEYDLIAGKKGNTGESS